MVKTCDPIELRMMLRVSIVVPIFAVVNALLNDVIVPYIEKSKYPPDIFSEFFKPKCLRNSDIAYHHYPIRHA